MIDDNLSSVRMEPHRLPVSHATKNEQRGTSITRASSQIDAEQVRRPSTSILLSIETGSAISRAHLKVNDGVVFVKK